MSQTHVEEMNDLEVAVWIQDINTKEVFNSSFLYEYTGHRYPARNMEMTENADTYIVTWEAPEQGTPTGYNVYFNNELVLENTSDLSYSFAKDEDFYIVEVVALYEEGTSVGVIASDLDGVSIQETMSKDGNVEVYPNPARDYIKLSANNYQLSAVRIYNYLGILIEEIEVNSSDIEINVSDYSNGVYFIEVQTENGNIVKKIIKN